VQTPQGFSRPLLVAAHEAAAGAAADESESATDDAGLVELLGRTVLVVGGAEEAFKVTRPIDLVLAEAVLARRRAAGVNA
jgi:2-C-methyl-D-erythritol 4-phosphate cytidylyltransferase